MELNRIIEVDCLTGLRGLPDQSVNMCVTSPPYWGLRDYGVEGQHGLESSPDEFIAQQVEVFREVRRVLKDDGTLWVNIGDSYANGARNRTEDMVTGGRVTGKRHQIAGKDQPNKITGGLKRKDIVGIPWMLAFALRADGWYLRQDIIWHKPNPMPESVTDRCTKSHEYIFLLSKNVDYHYDQDAITEQVSPNTHARLSQDVQNQIGSSRANGGAKTNGNMKAVGRKSSSPGSGIKNNSSFNDAMCIMPERRNKRSVWTVVTQPFKEAHFATFPSELPAICIKAGCPEGGIVLDPYMGAGTTALVARKLQRNFIGFELNPDYIKIAERRLKKELGMFS